MNPNRPTKSEVRKQSKAAKKFASNQPRKAVDPRMWRLIAPKAARQ
jgi:hypothetical protein